MRTLLTLAALAAALITASPLRAEDDGEAYRKLLSDKAPLIVTVKFVLKTDFRGRTQESNQEVLGVVVDASGLVMVANQSLGGNRNLNVMGQSISLKAVPSDFKVMFGNETQEYEAVLAAKDSKLNLGFVQIKDLEGRKPAALSFEGAAEPQVGQELVGVMRFGRGFDFAPAFALARVCGEIKMPRKMWALTGGFSGAGLPLFDRQGRLAGVLTAQEGATGEGGGQSMGIMNLFSGGGLGGLLPSTFLVPAKKVAATVRQVLPRAKEALEKVKDDDEGGDEEEKDDGGEKDDGF